MKTNADDCWYREVEDRAVLSQGQLLFAFTVFDAEPSEEPPKLIRERSRTWIIATQSCDTGDATDILLVLVQTATSMGLGKDRLKGIAKGNSPTYYLLPPDEKSGIDGYLVCDLANFAVVPKRRIISFVAGKSENPEDGTTLKKTVQLRPPYLEHFSAALGRVFSRVALDQNTWERSDFGDKKVAADGTSSAGDSQRASQ